MKFANIKKPLSPELLEYARKYNFRVAEIYDKAHEFVDITQIVTKILFMAKESGAEEFCFKEIRYRYNIADDIHTWHISIYGFWKNVETKR